MSKQKILAIGALALFLSSQTFALSCPAIDPAPISPHKPFSKAQLVIWTPPQYPQIKGSVICFYQNPNGNVYPYTSIPTPEGDSWQIRSTKPVTYECVNTDPLQCQYTLR